MSLLEYIHKPENFPPMYKRFYPQHEDEIRTIDGERALYFAAGSDIVVPGVVERRERKGNVEVSLVRPIMPEEIEKRGFVENDLREIYGNALKNVKFWPFED